MSWFVGPIHSDVNSIADTLNPKNLTVGGQDKNEKHVAEAVEAAAVAAVSIARVGAVGGEKVSVSLSGHANPNHEPNPPWANDTISVSVTQL